MRKASGIASSPTSPDSGHADKVAHCFNVDDYLQSLPLTRITNEPLIMDDEAAAKCEC